MTAPRIDWLAISFAIAFSLWLAADRYVGFYLGFPMPVPLSAIAAVLCLIAIALIGIRNKTSALWTFAVGLVIVAAMDRVWKYAIHPTDEFKLVAIALLFATPIIAALGAFCFWRAWKRVDRVPAWSKSAPSIDTA